MNIASLGIPICEFCNPGILFLCEIWNNSECFCEF